jgi:hypothetical protein
MDIQTQVQTLINESPADESMQQGIQVVAEVLGQVAQGFGHLQYFVLQNLQNQWQVTTLQHRAQPDLQKTVLYAYGHLSDATRMGKSEDLIALPIAIVPLLFQFFSFAEVESLLFIDEINNPDQIKELKRQDLQALVQDSLQQHLLNTPQSLAPSLNNIA